MLIIGILSLLKNIYIYASYIYMKASFFVMYLKRSGPDGIRHSILDDYLFFALSCFILTLKK